MQPPRASIVETPKDDGHYNGEDVILGAPWLDRMAASLKFPERNICFKYREKEMTKNAYEMGRIIPLVNTSAFDKLM